MNEVAKNLKKIRVSSGMTQEELAEKMFVTRQTISNWENGKSQPDVQTLTSLADSFGVEVSELIYGRKRPYIRFQKKIHRNGMFKSCSCDCLFYSGTNVASSSRRTHGYVL